MHLISIHNEICHFFHSIGAVLDRNIDQPQLNQSFTVPESLEYVRKLIAYIDRVQDQCGKVRRLLEVVDEDGLIDLAEV